MFEATSLGEPENAVGFVVWRISQHYQREMDRALASVDLTNLQFITLAQVAWFNQFHEAVNQSTVSRASGIHPMQLSLMLKTLEAKGFVSRARSERDTRAKEVAVTRAGVTALRSAFPLAIEVQHALFGKDGKPGGNLLTMLRALDDKLNGLQPAPARSQE